MNNSINLNSVDLNNSIAEPGTYTVKLESYKVIPAVRNLTDPDPESERNTSYLIDPNLPADAIIRQEYLLLNVAGDYCFSIRIYPKRVNYFMHAINKQFNYNLSGKKLSEILKYLATHPFNIQLTYHPSYGEQFDFRAE